MLPRREIKMKEEATTIYKNMHNNSIVPRNSAITVNISGAKTAVE
jgi:hypothetical protein